MTTRTPASRPSPAIRRVACSPSSPGIRMSISTTSGVSSRTSRTASAPSAASPTTSMPSWASSRAANPARTRAWSSASSTRIIAGSSGSVSRAGGPGPGSRRPARGPAVSRPPSAVARSGMPRIPLPPPLAPPRDGQAVGPVVLDLDHQVAVIRRDPDADAGGVRVPHHVGQRLLHDPVRGRVRAAGQGRRGDPHVDAEAGCLGSSCQLFHVAQARRGRARHLLAGPAQRVQHRLDVHQSFAARLLDRGQRGPDLLRPPVHQLERHPRLHVDQRQAVRHHVVQVPGDAEPLLARLPPGRLVRRALLLDRPPPAGLGEGPPVADQLAPGQQEQQPGCEPSRGPGRRRRLAGGEHRQPQEAQVAGQHRAVGRDPVAGHQRGAERDDQAYPDRAAGIAEQHVAERRRERQHQHLDRLPPPGQQRGRARGQQQVSVHVQRPHVRVVLRQPRRDADLHRPGQHRQGDVHAPYRTPVHLSTVGRIAPDVIRPRV